MQIREIAVENLRVSPLNVRKHDVNGIKELAASIAAIGLLSPIIVRPEGEGYEIVAGQRRFLAMKELGKPVVPAFIPGDTSDTTSLEISLAENFARKELDPLEMCEAFMAIKATAEHLTVNDLADRFGVTSAYVAKCLKLADLPEDIRKYARKKGVDIDILKAVTVLPPTMQKAWKKAHAAEESWAEHPRSIVRSSMQDKPRVGMNVFDLSEYDGAFHDDLFNDKAYFADEKQFAELQAKAVEAEAEKLRAEGWQWVQTFLDPMRGPSLHSYGKSKNKKIAGAVVMVDWKRDENEQFSYGEGNCVIRIETGLLDPEQVKAIERDKKKAEKQAEAAAHGDDGQDAEAGDKPLSNLMCRVHGFLAHVVNANTVAQERDPVALLHIVCDMLADGTLVPNVPRFDTDIEPIVGEIRGREPTPGTSALKQKLTQAERFKLLRQILARSATATDLSKVKPAAGIRELWTPNETYLSKLDKERVASVAEDIGLKQMAASLREGKLKRAEAVKFLAKVFAGEDGTVAIKKAAGEWVPTWFGDFQNPREYVEAE
jgi:ParB/RepB/Spo0J family partition protein